MIRKLFTFTLLFVFIAIQSINAQEPEAQLSPISPFKYAIKNNLQLTYQYDGDYFYIQPFSPAFFVRTKNGLAHEFELNHFNMGMYDTRDNNAGAGRLHKNINLQLRYQFNYYFIKRETKIAPYLGASVLTGLYVTRHTPASTFNFPASHTGTKLSLAVVPGFNYNISKRVFLDFNVPFTFYEFNYERHRVRNPAWSAREQTSSTTKMDMPLDRFLQARLGFGINF